MAFGDEGWEVLLGIFWYRRGFLSLRDRGGLGEIPLPFFHLPLYIPRHWRHWDGVYQPAVDSGSLQHRGFTTPPYRFSNFTSDVPISMMDVDVYNGPFFEYNALDTKNTFPTLASGAELNDTAVGSNVPNTGFATRSPTRVPSTSMKTT